ncbi:hypothetical protein D915_008503 [Fasciola hepatica]|uniref:Uncharacterized protein n=1 Tax=Fasciola hepatica TaxID=6192 RepID=A0A4E0R5C8_FASHE|nr:hypothetical protein D915_008503 [Fasciola hepatica]
MVHLRIVRLLMAKLPSRCIVTILLMLLQTDGRNEFAIFLLLNYWSTDVSHRNTGYFDWNIYLWGTMFSEYVVSRVFLEELLRQSHDVML